MLDFKSANIRNVGGQAGERNVQWATLEIRFRDSETDHDASTDLTLLVPKSAGVTLGEIEEAARKSAITTLQAALVLLEGSSLAELRAREEAAEDAEQTTLQLSYDSLGFSDDADPLRG